MNKKRKIVSCVLSAALISSVLPYAVSASAAEPKVRIVVENNTNTGDSAAWTGILVDEWVDLKGDSTAVSLFTELLNEKGYTQTGAESGYVTDINGVKAEGMGGWMFGYDDWYGNNGITAFKADDGTLSDGDEICFSYSMDWGVDIGSDFNNTSTKLSSLSSDKGEVEKKEETTYILTLPEGTETVKLTPTAENKNYRFKIYKNDYTPESNNDYKRSQEIPVENGDKIYIGVGHASWHGWMPDGVTETVYTVDVDIQAAEESSRPEPEESVPDEKSDSSKAEESSDVSDDDISFDEMLSAVTEKVLSAEHSQVGYEWENMTLARLGKLSDEDKAAYLVSLEDNLKAVSSLTATDCAKYTIVLTAMGVDASDFGGHNFIDELSDPEFGEKQGINGVVYSLIALNTKPYEEINDTVKETMLEKILSAQLNDGGWTFYGDNYDADMTGMALQALAPYYVSDEKVKTAVDKAIALLSEEQNENGTFSSFGIENSDSTSQIITALSSLGIDADKDERFIKNGKSVLDGLKLFYKNGDFSHNAGGEVNKYSTAEAFYALCSYYRFKNNMNSLYDMSDVSEYSEVSQQEEKSTVKIEESSAPSENSQTSKTSQISTASSAVSQSQAVSSAVSVSSTVNDSVKTADGSSVMLRYTLIIFIAAGILIILVMTQKKKQKDDIS